MGNSTSAGQGNYTTCGLRDAERATKQGQHCPTELAKAPIKKTYSLFSADPNLHTDASNVGGG